MGFVAYFDIIIIAIIVILALKGLFSGFIRETCSMLGIIGGVLVASRYSGAVGDLINDLIAIESQTLRNLIGFMLILALIWVGFLVIAEILVRFATFIKLGKLDKVLGVGIAAVKIFLVVSIILFTFSKMNFLSNFTANLAQNSLCYPVMIKIGNFIVKTDFAQDLSEQATQNLQSGLDELNSALDAASKE